MSTLVLGKPCVCDADSVKCLAYPRFSLVALIFNLDFSVNLLNHLECFRARIVISLKSKSLQKIYYKIT